MHVGFSDNIAVEIDRGITRMALERQMDARMAWRLRQRGLLIGGGQPDKYSTPRLFAIAQEQEQLNRRWNELDKELRELAEAEENAAVETP